MDKFDKPSDDEEKNIKQLANEIDPEDKEPESLAEATTAPLADGALGCHATQTDVK